MIRFAAGGADEIVTLQQAEELLSDMVDSMEPLKRVLIIPPDITRFHSWAGELTAILYRLLEKRARVELLPALGTHSPMTASQLDRMFPGVPHDRFHVHDWRRNLTHLGTIEPEFVAALSGGAVRYPMHCEVNRLLLDGHWDRIVSVGQLVPHEVIGIANHVKNILVGVGGKDIIDKTHFLGAVCNMETIMGRAETPVRKALNEMAHRFLKDLPITYILTVRGNDREKGLVTRGLFGGDDDECFRVGATLSQRVNINLLDKPISRALVYLDPSEYKSTWLGNKAIYRTRMAMADGGELIIVGPGVREFGEDAAIDKLIRRFGYHGTARTLDAVKHDEELGMNLSAAAHLIHGSSEGRFRIVWCAGGSARREIEAAGYAWASPEAVASRFDLDSLEDGLQIAHDGKEIFYVRNPALGLWALREKFSWN